jgi:hypothetical protein
VRQLKRPPLIRTIAQLPTGSEKYRYSARSWTQVRNGPGEPPPGFLKATVSETEWWVYWACARIFKNPVNPRIGPFVGGPPEWTYQQPYIGGRFTPLGAVIDFIVWRTPTGRPLGIRVQTEHWHLFASHDQQVSDLMQRGRLMETLDVVDIYDYAFTGDPTGQAVIQTVKGALGLIELGDPLRAGTVRRNTVR